MKYPGIRGFVATAAGVLALLLALPLLAEEPRRIGDLRVDELAEELDLSDEQRRDLDDIVSEYRRDMDTLETDANEVRERVHNTSLGAMGYGEVIGISRELGRIGSQKAQTMLEAQVDFYDILAPEQQSRLTQIRAENREERDRLLRGLAGQLDLDAETGGEEEDETPEIDIGED